jgi:hypothetical protein
MIVFLIGAFGNVKYAWLKKKTSEKFAIKAMKKVREIRQQLKDIMASLELKISLSCIKDVLKQKQKSTKGFIFKYLEENK